MAKIVYSCMKNAYTLAFGCLLHKCVRNYAGFSLVSNNSYRGGSIAHVMNLISYNLILVPGDVCALPT